MRINIVNGENMEILIDKIPEDLAVDSEILSIINTTVEKIGQLYAVEDSEVSITITDNDNIHLMNKQYRNIDRPTDVLSFALNEGQEPEITGGPSTNILGDIIISFEKVQEQAADYGHSLKRELAFLTTHGMLHLLGYDHIEEKDRIEMRKEEEFVMQQLGIER
ncbi:putative rRNA maturation factor [Pectinatus brassicae]|uniref:Endoribonuclease YbeY n=2 Tax=Pectinatus brassicae TaxID=862415 RepID=A0A840UW74_9FIRM|nr:putative rRNA maturation factor [Pectinatus brassicae]